MTTSPPPGARALTVWGAAVAAYAIAVLHRSSLGVAGLETASRFGVSASVLASLAVAQLIVYAAFQILSSRFSSEIAQLSRTSGHNLQNEIDFGVAKFNSVLTTPASAEALWLAAGLAVVALAFAVTRAVEDL